jgi:ABC-type multidrug transport system fused ATPase/permease subunit
MFGLWVGHEVFGFFINPYWVRMYSKLLTSYQVACQKIFLTVDSIYHTTRSSGEVLAKVDRGGDALDGILYLFTEDLFGVFTRAFISAGALFILGPVYGITGVIFTCIILICSAYIEIILEKTMRPIIIEKSDEKKQIKLENLIQIQYIRSIFVTQNQFNKFVHTEKLYNSYSSLKWRLHNILGKLVAIVFYMLFALMLYIIYQQAKSNEISPAIAIGVVTSLFANLGEIIWIGQKNSALCSQPH